MEARHRCDRTPDDAVEIGADLRTLALLQVVADLALLGDLRAVFDGRAGQQVFNRLGGRRSFAAFLSAGCSAFTSIT